VPVPAKLPPWVKLFTVKSEHQIIVKEVPEHLQGVVQAVLQAWESAALNVRKPLGDIDALGFGVQDDRNQVAAILARIAGN
jgi:hypothetical protein